MCYCCEFYIKLYILYMHILIIHTVIRYNLKSFYLFILIYVYFFSGEDPSVAWCPWCCVLQQGAVEVWKWCILQGILMYIILRILILIFFCIIWSLKFFNMSQWFLTKLFVILCIKKRPFSWIILYLLDLVQCPRYFLNKRKSHVMYQTLLWSFLNSLSSLNTYV